MSNVKYRCPSCGNANLTLSQESKICRMYKVRDNGVPDKFPYITIDRSSDLTEEHLECPSCNLRCDFSDKSELAEWENV